VSPPSGNGRQPARARRTALAAGSPPAPTTPASTQISRSARQRAIRELVGRRPFESQAQLVRELTDRGFVVTQATVSRDIAELGLVKVTRGGRHVYVAPEDLAPRPVIDDRLRRVLADTSVTVGRSGLILVLTSSPGTANTIAQGIDESSLHEQEGTLAGDNTLLVLFADEERLERWLRKFREMQGLGLPDPGRPTNETRRSQEADR
jgi:transcriptional regulator of arginine metabolism